MTPRRVGLSLERTWQLQPSLSSDPAPTTQRGFLRFQKAKSHVDRVKQEMRDYKWREGSRQASPLQPAQLTCQTLWVKSHESSSPG